MGYYTLTAPGVVTVNGRHRHYTTVPAEPIELDDAAAAPQVKSGVLRPYNPGPPSIEFGPITVTSVDDATKDSVAQSIRDAIADSAEADEPEAAPRRRRRKDDTSH